jgi:hypothetical protein
MLSITKRPLIKYTFLLLRSPPLYRGRLSTEPKRDIFQENNGARVSEEINEDSTSETGEIEEDSTHISQVNSEASTSGTCEIEADNQA